MTSTPGRLRWLLGLLAVAAAGLWLVGTVQVSQARAVVERAAVDAAPAAVAARTAIADLVDADRAAILSRLNGAAALSGPGQRYQDDIAGAGQALEQLGEHNVAGTTGSRQLEEIEALLVTYTGLVEQGDAAGAGGELAAADLWYASKLLHDPDSGILARIDGLGTRTAGVLRGERSSWWLRPAALATYAAVAVLVFAVLVLGQVGLARRFHRVLGFLALAAVVTAALGAWTGAVQANTVRRAGTAFDDRLPALQSLWSWRARATDADGRLTLAALLGSRCPATGCVSTVESTVTGLVSQATTAWDGTGAASDTAPPLAVPRELVPLRDADRAAADALRSHRYADATSTLLDHASTFASLDNDLNDRTLAASARLRQTWSAAAGTAGIGTGGPVLAVAVLALVVAGVKPRLDEYRGARS